jgi:hypothetical protein
MHNVLWSVITITMKILKKNSDDKNLEKNQRVIRWHFYHGHSHFASKYESVAPFSNQLFKNQNVMQELATCENNLFVFDKLMEQSHKRNWCNIWFWCKQGFWPHRCKMQRLKITIIEGKYTAMTAQWTVVGIPNSVSFWCSMKKF